MGRMVDLTVYGTPAPQGSKRHVGKGIMVESSDKVKPWREAVKAASWQAGQPIVPLEGPLNVTVVFTLLKPASAPKTKRTWPCKRPDLDKLLRSTLDALGDSGVFRDDAQVVSVMASKVYPREGANALEIPGARIWVSEVVA
jgi:crossover junction endodeoxyribonuclease RusA